MLNIYTLLILEASVVLITAALFSHIRQKERSTLGQALVIVCICAGTIGISAYYRGFFFLIQFAISWVCIVPIFAGLLLFAIKQKKASNYFFSVAILLFCITATTMAHTRAETQNLKQYCREYSFILNDYRLENNRYPNTLAKLEPPVKFKPLAIRFHGADEICGYTSLQEKHYGFYVSTGLFSGWFMNNETPFWQEVD